LLPLLLQCCTESKDVGIAGSTACNEGPCHAARNNECSLSLFLSAESKDVGIAGSTATMEASTTKKSPLIAPDSGAGHHHVL
jgi:hypothetical protein